MTPPRKTIPINGCTKRSIIPTSNRQSVATLRASGFRSGSDVCLDVVMPLHRKVLKDAFAPLGAYALQSVFHPK